MRMIVGRNLEMIVISLNGEKIEVSISNNSNHLIPDIR
jgi:hypothetical protein